MDDRIKIERYTYTSARLVIDQLTPPVNMLWMHAHIINNWTKEEAGLLPRGAEVPKGHHLVYSFGLQPQGDMTMMRWLPRFNLEFSGEDFKTLHAMLIRFKALDQSFIEGSIPDKPVTLLAETSDRLCFEVSYAIISAIDEAGEEKFEAQCDALRVYTLIGGKRLDIGAYHLRDGIEDMHGLTQEAERLQAVIQGGSLDEIKAIKQIRWKEPRYFVPKPTLRIVRTTDT